MPSKMASRFLLLSMIFFSSFLFPAEKDEIGGHNDGSPSEEQNDFFLSRSFMRNKRMSKKYTRINRLEIIHHKPLLTIRNF